MKLLVTGSRDFSDEDMINTQLDYLLSHANPILIHGGARGADSLAAKWCRRNPKVYEIRVDAKWNLLGKSAGMARNLIMAELRPERVAAFFKVGAANVGTRGMVRLARDYGIRDITEHWGD